MGAGNVIWPDTQSMLGFVMVSQEYPSTAEQVGCRLVTKKSME